MNINLQGKEIIIDKKYIVLGIIVLLAIILLLMFSKNNNKLECVYTTSNSTANLIETYTANFENNKLSTLVVSFKNSPTKDYLSMLDAIYDNYFEQLEKLKNSGGYEYKIEKGQNFIYFESTIDLNTIPDSTKIAVGFNNEWNYEDFKNNLEKNGFNCK